MESKRLPIYRLINYIKLFIITISLFICSFSINKNIYDDDNDQTPKIGMVEYTKRIYYSQLYKMYMFKISCLEIATEQGVNHFPTMIILYHIGIWNLVLATSLVLISAALYCTPSEIQMMNDSTKSYTPKWRRKSVTWWMKNQCANYGKRIGKSLENKIKLINRLFKPYPLGPPF